MELSAPVLMLRWFHGGAGYAYDARLTQADLTVIVTALEGVMSEPPGRSFRYLLQDGRVLLGDIHAERDCLDSRAAHRRPVVIRAALLPRPLGSHEEVMVRDRLAALALPTAPSPHRHGLCVALPRPVVCPVPAEAGHRWARRLVPWLAVGLILALEWLLHLQPDFGGSTLGWACRIVGLLVLMAVYRQGRLPLATQQDLTEREQELCTGERPPWSSLLAPGAWLVLPDGHCLDGATLSSAPAASLPLALLEPEYDVALAYPGMAILRGRERLTLPDGREVTYRFLRGYTRSQGRWRLQLAQWWHPPQDPVEARPRAVAGPLGEEALADREEVPS